MSMRNTANSISCWRPAWCAAGTVTLAIVLAAGQVHAEDMGWPLGNAIPVVEKSGASDRASASGKAVSKTAKAATASGRPAKSVRSERQKPAAMDETVAGQDEAEAKDRTQEPQGQSSAHTWEWGGEKKVAASGKALVAVDQRLKPREIYVSFSDRRLYYVTKPGEAVAYPIAIPRKQDDWQGVMRVSDKRVNPSWTPTPTMIKENPRLPSYVPGGHPYNPMGVRALYLGSTAYRIHGTDAPWTIGEPVSKGCIRLYNKDVVDLYEQVKLGTRVTVTWDSFSGKVVAGKVVGRGFSRAAGRTGDFGETRATSAN